MAPSDRKGDATSITHVPGRDASRGTFDLLIAGKRSGHLDYSLPNGKTMNIDYVEVSPALRGQRMGERLVAAAVKWAADNERQVVPYCSFARAVMARRSMGNLLG